VHRSSLSLLAVAVCAITLSWPTALHAQSFASLLELESSRCVVDVHAEVGGNGSNDDDGKGRRCEPISLFEAVTRYSTTTESETCGEGGGGARSSGWSNVYAGPRSVGSFELWVSARAYNQASGGSSCNFDSRSQVDIELRWRVIADVEVEYQPLLPCDSNGKRVSALLTIDDQVFDLEKACALEPVRLSLEAGDLIYFDASLDERRKAADTELGIGIRLREAPDPGPPLRGVELGAPETLNTNAATDSGEDIAADIATDDDGVWVTVWSSTEDLGGTLGRDSDILFAQSTERGQSWSDPGALAVSASDDTGNDEAPDIVFDGRGTWVAAWHSDDSQAGLVGDDFDVLCVSSVDGGTTWTAPLPLNNNAATDGGDDLYVELHSDGEGHVLAAWQSTDDLGGSIGVDSDILVAHSSDGCTAWSDPAPADPGAASDSNEDTRPSLATDRAGNWVLALEVAPALTGIPGVSVASSRDDAQTWSPPLPLDPVAVASGSQQSRGQVAFSPPATWMVVWHSYDWFAGTIGTDADIVAATTEDLDSGWGRRFALDPDADRDSGSDRAPSIASIGPGAFLVPWSTDEPALGGLLRDHRVIALSGSVEAGGFSEPQSISNGPQERGAESRVPAVAVDSAGDVVVVWHANAEADGSEGPDNDIFFAAPEPAARWLGLAALLTLLALLTPHRLRRSR
jgi:hypothetical protein